MPDVSFGREGARGTTAAAKEKASPERSRTIDPAAWLQRAAGNAAVTGLVSRSIQAGGGSPGGEDEATRRWGPPRDDANEEAEARESESGGVPAFDPSRAIIHTDGEAGALADGLGVAAFTRGRDVYLHSRVGLQTALGNRVLAHELTHVAQQERSGVTAIQRYPDPVPVVQSDADAAADQQTMALLDSQPAYLPLNDAVRWGGLTGWRTRLPRSYAEVRRRAVQQWSEPAIASLSRTTPMCSRSSPSPRPSCPGCSRRAPSTTT